MRRIAGVFILFGALIPICVIVAGVIYERAAEKKDREGIPQIGQSIDIGGRSLNIYCSGQGSPAVILEAANGPGLFWSDIQAEIAKFTTACWYDRAGEGWIGDRPLIVLTAGKPLPWGDPEMARQAAVYQEIWINEIQSKLVRLSRRGRQVIVTKSDHGIPVQAPDAVVAAIQEVVADVRQK